MKPVLAPVLPPDRLFPPGVAYAARPDPEDVVLVGLEAWNCETVTGLMLGALNGRTTIRHRSVAHPDALALIGEAGLPIAERMHLYDTPEEFERIARGIRDGGLRLAGPYPLPARIASDDGLLVPDALWRRLNDKARLAELVSARYLAPRRFATLDALRATPPTHPVFLKVFGPVATGTGHAVHPVETPSALAAALDNLAAQSPGDIVLVEDAVAVERCYCVHFAVTDDAVQMIGMAEQRFAEPARQSGSRITGRAGVPPALAAIAREAADRAARLGFRGVAALDIGVRPGADPIVFDPNFRINFSTQQVLFHDAIADRSGNALTESFVASSAHPIERTLRRLRPFVEEGAFVPFRCVDRRALEALPSPTHVLGVVSGRDPQDAEDVATALRSALS
ncbi:MAG: hypothetical protein ACPGID_08940 [Rubricella sp.]